MTTDQKVGSSSLSGRAIICLVPKGSATSGPFDPQSAFNRAMQHHQSGRLDDAETLYRNILAGAPDHIDSLYLLGVIACQRGRHKAAIDLIERAISLRRWNPAAEFHGTIAEAFLALGQLDR